MVFIPQGYCIADLGDLSRICILHRLSVQMCQLIHVLRELTLQFQGILAMFNVFYVGQ